MSTQHIDTLIVGAGQAGLSTAYWLQQAGREFLVVDSVPRVGDNWRRHYESLRLYTPAKYDGLPGMAFPADPWHFPTRDEVADFLEAYALRWDIPVRTRTTIDRLVPNGDGYAAHIGGETITCDNVVVATGTFGRTPAVPGFAADLDPGITSLHSSEYRGPDQLQPGPVLVVGASHSGTDIAYELAADRPTLLAGRDCGEIPFRWDRRSIKAALPVMVFAWRHILTRRTPMGRSMMDHMRHHGAPMLRVKRNDLAARDVTRVTERVVDVRDGLPVLADGTVPDVRNIVWCTGFRQNFDWIEAPICGADGWPNEYRGVVDGRPGLFFCGLSFQYSFGSMVLPGVGADAAYIAGRIAEREAAKTAARV